MPGRAIPAAPDCVQPEVTSQLGADLPAGAIEGVSAQDWVLTCGGVRVTHSMTGNEQLLRSSVRGH
jgi:hypothetical protein